MKMITSSLVFAGLLSIACAKPVARSLIVHETRQSVPVGFTENGPASGSTVLTLRAALVQNNITGLESELYAVSTPSSPRYGQHLTKEEVSSYMFSCHLSLLTACYLVQVEEYVKPSSESVSLFTEWLSDNGISTTTISPAGDWLEFSVPVSQANELLDADFQVFTYESSGQQSIRTMSYSIPSNLQGHLALIHPTIS